MMSVVRFEASPERSAGGPRLRAGAAGRPGPHDPQPGGHDAWSTPRPSWPPRNLTGLTVVIIDDDGGSLGYFETALRAAGATVLTASTAPDGLRLVQERRPDVVLSDIAMPGKDGYWLVSEIRRLPSPAGEVPVVATTAYGRAHPRERALAAGFVDHLPKPVEPDVLCTAIARAAGR